MDRELQYGVSSFNAAVTKVFAWMFAAIVITFAVAFGGAILLSYIDPSIYLGVMIAAAVAQIVLIFVINFSGILSKKQGSVKVPFILYSIVMGILMSGIIAFTEISTILYALGATAICFGSMALIGWIGKTNMNVMSRIAMGLGLGSLVLVLLNYFIGSETIGWIVSFALFAFIMLITAVDVYRMKKTAESGQMTENLAIFFAFQIYYDFIYVFIRVLSFIQANRD